MEQAIALFVMAATAAAACTKRFSKRVRIVSGVIFLGIIGFTAFRMLDHAVIAS